MAKGRRKEDALARGAFGARLRSMRERSGLTQEELAGRSGLSPNAVSALERGQRRRPYPHTVRALADALELPEEGRAALLAAVPVRGEPAPSGAEAAGSSSGLSRPVTPLLGREREVEQVVALVLHPETRLLTLTGIGGVGKTRLAEEVAREVEASFSDGVAFVGLASLSDPVLFAPTVLRSLGQGEAEGQSAGEALVEHLRGRRLLLVLDNFEQLLDAALEGRISPALRSRALSVAASMAYAQGDHGAAGEYWREALRISVGEEDALAEGYARAGTGLFEMARSEFEAAASRFQTSLPIFERHGEEFMASLVRTWTGTTFLARGEPETTRRMLEEGLESARRRGNSLGTYVALYNLAQLALIAGDPALAADALRQGVELSEWTRDLANLAHFMEALATVAALRGEAKRAAVLLGAADGALRGVGAPVYNFYVTDPSLRERTVAVARSALGEATFEEVRARGETMTFDDAVGYALGSDDPPRSGTPG